MANIDTYLQSVADARARGDTHAVNWLTASWMPYSQTVRSAAKGSPLQEESPPTGPAKNGKIVFHPSTKRAALPAPETPTE